MADEAEKIELVFQEGGSLGDPFVAVMVNDVQRDKVWAYIEHEQKADGEWYSVVRFRR